MLEIIVIGHPLNPPAMVGTGSPGQGNGGISPGGGSISDRQRSQRITTAANIQAKIVNALKAAGFADYEARARAVIVKLYNSGYAVMLDSYYNATITVQVGTTPPDEAGHTKYRAFPGQTYDKAYPVEITLDMSKIKDIDLTRPLFFEMVIVHELLHPLTTNRHTTEVEKANYASQVQHIGLTMGYTAEQVANWY